VLGIHLTTTAALAFLSCHLPLTAKQREVQVWRVCCLLQARV
jgi:hypothetical protein